MLIREHIPLMEYYENPVITRTGRERIIAWHNSVLRNERGQVTGVLCSGEDITDRKLAQAAFLDTLQHISFLAGALENSSQPFGVGYPDGFAELPLEGIHVGPQRCDPVRVEGVEQEGTPWRSVSTKSWLASAGHRT